MEGSTAAQTRHFFKCFGSLWVEHVYERTNFDTDLCFSLCYVTLGLHDNIMLMLIQGHDNRWLKFCAKKNKTNQGHDNGWRGEV